MKNKFAVTLVVSLLLSVAALAGSGAQETPSRPRTRETRSSHRAHITRCLCFQPRGVAGASRISAESRSWQARDCCRCPRRRPLNPQVFGKLERDGYTIEKVLLETLPGFYLGGNLYRPLGRQGPFPAIVSPHGHWHYGRLENTAVVSVPGRAINLAKQGFVVFTYDMVGQNDTNQVPHHWGDARQGLWGIGSPMGMQLWDSIRAVDFVCVAFRCRSESDWRDRCVRRRHADVFPDGRG